MEIRIMHEKLMLLTLCYGRKFETTFWMLVFQSPLNIYEMKWNI